MLPLKMAQSVLAVLVTAACVWAIAGGMNLSQFVTARRSHNWHMDELLEDDALQKHIEFANEATTSQDDVEVGSYVLQRQQYKLRFRPPHAMPRLCWHKLPQKQQEQLPSTAAPGTQTTTTPAEKEQEPDPVPEPQPMPDATAPPVPTETLLTTSTSMATPLHNVSTSKPGTTATSIMRPPINYRPSFVNALKNLLFFGSPTQANLIQKQASAPKAKSKGFLSLFEVIKFENNKCSVTMGDIRSMEGVCYHEFECKSLGGIPTERCAEGVGVCCIFLTGCGDTSNQPVVYFESPNYPNAVRETMICVLTVNLRARVQQLRLDFLRFELNRPTNGDCVNDQFIVSGQDMNFVVPVLCGINTGQHIYVHAGDSLESKIYLSFFAKVVAGGRSFNIKVTQLESELAPSGCLQYYTETEGMLKSFNYDLSGTIVDNMEATYFNNLNYVICMKRAKETCTVTYATEQLGGDQPEFQIVNKDEAENDLVPDGQAGAGIFNCPDDFLGINQVRLCGERFNDGTDNEDFTQNAAIKDTAAGPIMLPFRTDEEYVGRGFRLVYKQQLCI